MRRYKGEAVIEAMKLLGFVFEVKNFSGHDCYAAIFTNKRLGVSSGYHRGDTILEALEKAAKAAMDAAERHAFFNKEKQPWVTSVK